MSNYDYDELYDILKTYMTVEDIEEIHATYMFARSAHEGQLRKSGEPFIAHPVAVAIILANIQMPKSIIISALLHDVVEDTIYTYDEIKERFGEDIANIVDGVTKLGNLKGYSKTQAQAANHRKIIIASAKDIRVILVKLADRLHNMKTINHMNEAKQKAIAKETLEVYAPIAHRLGMYEIKWELEDLSFRCINKEAYDEIVQLVDMKRCERDEIVKNIIIEVLDFFDQKEINATITGRTKHFYSIFKKILDSQKEFAEITDLFAFRVIVKTIPECYIVLGAIHELYKPIPMKFKDYIPTPKHNMYQSIHTTVLTSLGFPIEFQIRTEAMDYTAEVGIASHFSYKNNMDLSNVDVASRLPWLKRVLDENEDDIDSETFMENVKLNFFQKNVIVYTPNGDVVEIPQGSTVLDFAYYIHTDIGNKATSAEVNDRIVSLFYPLKIGDVVNIITSDIASPSLSYIQKVKTNRAKEALKKYFKNNQKSHIRIEGKQFIRNLYVTDPKLKFSFDDEKSVEDLLLHFGFPNLDDFYYAVGIGDISVDNLTDYFKGNKSKKIIKNDVILYDEEELINNYKFCENCAPVYGDDICAIKKKIGREHIYVIHRNSCNYIKKNQTLQASFNTAAPLNKKYIGRFYIETKDIPGVATEIVGTIADFDINIDSMYFRGGLNNLAYGRFSISIEDVTTLDILLNKLKKLDVVLKVHRLNEKE